MSDSEEVTIKCYYAHLYDTNKGKCNEFPSKEEVREFHALLDKADENNSSEFDTDLEYPNIETYVDEKFYVCPNHQYIILCDECDEMLTRSQLQNYINSSDYNHLNEGLCVGPAGCTSCWIRYDRELQCELGVDSDGEYKNSEDEEEEKEEEQPEYPPLPPSPPPPPKKITLEDLKDGAKNITQKRIQDENVKYGLARCKRESKAKSIKKLQDFLTAHPNAKYLNERTKINICELHLFGHVLKYTYPPGKTLEDFVQHVKVFFEV